MRLTDSPQALAFALAAVVAVAVSLTTTSPARAEPSAAERAIAQRAFDEGRALFARGEIQAACEKFAVSRRLDPKLGTVMNLAICLERAGRLASAYAELVEAESLARREGRAAVLKDAQARAQAIAPRLPRAVLTVDATVKELRVDGVPLDPAAWSSEIPLDPGPHTIRASAPGRSSREQTIVLGEGNVTSVAIGPLQEEDAPSLPAPATTGEGPPPARAGKEDVATAPSSSRRTVGVVVGGAGLVLTAVGAAFGAVAIARRQDAEDASRGGDVDRGRSINDQASTFAWTSNIGVGVGLVAVAAGVVLWVTAPRTTTTAGVLVPSGLRVTF